MYSFAICPLAAASFSDVTPDLYATGDLKLCRGLAKLVGQTVFLIFTAPGSIEGMPQFGVDIRGRLGRYSLDQTPAIDAELIQIAAELKSQLQYTTRLNPPDERLKDLTMALTTNIFEDELVVQLGLLSEAGTTAQYDLDLFSRVIT